MDIKAELIEARSRLLSGIESAARGGDSTRVVQLSELLPSVDGDDVALGVIEQHLLVYMGTLNGKSSLGLVGPLPGPVAKKASSKKRGEDTRKAFAAEKRLTHERLIAYRTPSGKRVGIATATERRPNRWWLGLPDELFDVVVLLCDRNGVRLDFVLPPEFVTRIWRDLSRSGPNVKFSVLKGAGSYQLQIPGQKDPDVGIFLGRYESLS